MKTRKKNKFDRRFPNLSELYQIKDFSPELKKKLHNVYSRLVSLTWEILIFLLQILFRKVIILHIWPTVQDHDTLDNVHYYIDIKNCKFHRWGRDRFPFQC